MQLFTKSVKRLFLPALVVAVSASELAAQQADSIQVSTSVGKINANQLRVSGTIKDARTGKPIPGVSVSVSNYAAALSDDKGVFKISIPNLNALLLVSAQGYQSKQVSLKGSKQVEISLFEDSYSSVYDVAQLPYGDKPLSQAVYSVATINTGGSWNRANETADSYLQGSVAGLNATRRSGTPGIGADLLIRGYNSLYATSQPLVVVDGMIYDVNTYANSLISGHRTNHLANVDLKDIDNITVIKDGTSLYGTRGSNGVILITTGRAKGEATRLDFGAYGGFNSKVENLPVMGADKYRIYLADLLKSSGSNDGQIGNMPFMNETVYPAYSRTTNWQDEVINGGYSKNYYLKVSGGDNIATYALSMGYLDNDGLTKNTNLTRYQTRFNANLNLSQKLKATANLAFSRAEQNLRDQGRSFDTNPLYLGLVKAPFLYPYEIPALGKVSPNLADVDDFSMSNPFSAVDKAIALDRNYRFVGSVGFDYAFNKKFNLQSVIGITYDKIRENTLRPRLGVVPEVLNTAVGENRPGANVVRYFSVYTDTWASYKHSFNTNHSLKANLGFRFNSSKSESDYGIGYNTASDEFVTLGGVESTLRIVGGGIGKWNWLNTYANMDYSAYNKYFLSFNVAADASSRFGADAGSLSVGGTRVALLPAVGAGWLISSENFMAGQKAIETLKLRASYGLSGNEDIGNYGAKKYYVSQGFLNRQGLVRGNIGNSSMKWEAVKKANIGLDAALYNERINLSIDVYNTNISDMLVYEPTGSFSGFPYALANSGSMQNTGLELAVNARIINKEKLVWGMGLNLGTYKNKIKSLPAGMPLNSYAGATFLMKEGRAANLFYGYKTNGIYASTAEATASGLMNKLSNGSLVPFQGGDVRFVNANGDAVIDKNDMQVIGNPNPDFVGGLSNMLTYRRWSLDALFTFSVGNDIYNATRASLESMSGYENQTLAVLNRWRTDGQVTNMPRAAWGDPAENARFSDRWIEDGSYFKLRTVSLSYDVPFKAAFMKYATVYATANNVFTISKYLGYDPEFSSQGSIFARGVDTGLEPIYKSVQLGVRVGL